jgi:hypothetical protein
VAVALGGLLLPAHQGKTALGTPETPRGRRGRAAAQEGCAITTYRSGKLEKGVIRCAQTPLILFARDVDLSAAFVSQQCSPHILAST